MAAKFEIRSAKAGEYTWVVTSQGRTLATGESYSRRASAEKAVEAFRKAVPTATIVDLTVKAPAKAPTKSTKAAKKPAAKAIKTGSTTEKSAGPRKRTSRSG